MKQVKLKNVMLATLKNDDRLWNQDKTELNQTLLLDLIEKIDETIVGLLLQEEDLREKFFVKIKDVYVFKTNDFRFFIEENKIENSYTAYKNRIGLTDGKKFLKDTNDVVLNFPYKDCVLEGGQSTEEGNDIYFEYSEKSDEYEKKQGKRKEIFFNSVLADDEIDRLFDPKALINWKRFSKDGEQEVKEIKRDEEGIIKENLIIKGNNLLALHSLKKQFTGKVKLIYIDPPYNTGNDGFKYNDNFNHSTWLTFMKNRLEVARELLRDDGVIFVQCDDNEQAYLKVLMDEVFGRENFVSNLIWERKSGRQNDAKFYSTNHELILNFAKKKCFFKPKLLERTQEMLEDYKNPDNDNRGLWTSITLQAKSGTEKNIYTIKFPNGIEWAPPKGTFARFSKEKLLELYNDNRLYFGETGLNKPRLKKFLSDVKDGVVSNTLLFSNEVSNTQKAKTELQQLFNINVFDTPKPEKLLQYLINLSTNKDDIILDYHLGSGTTCAVAHKMERQYIGIEQMDYVETIACERLKKVIEGEQGGISKSVNWQGGGDFIYFELAKWNETAKEKILACDSLEALNAFFDEMYERYFLNYNLKIKEFREQIIKEEEFKNLSLDEQKNMFITMLDNNQMYVNKTEMADKKFGISEKDQKLTEQFYDSEK